ncbi:MAG: ECF-type sigma factor [Phycisphaerales bacterium]
MTGRTPDNHRPIERPGNVQPLPDLYRSLREMAASALSRLRPGGTLQTTALVHEAYIRLVDKGSMNYGGQREFFLSAARAMHDILVEQARAKAALKRGGGRRRERADPAGLLAAPTDAPAEDLLELHTELESLEREDPEKHRIVQLRFFAGLTAEQTGAVMGLSTRTVERHWRYIRARLHRALTERKPGETS